MNKQKAELLYMLKKLQIDMVSAAKEIRAYSGKQNINAAQIEGAASMVREWIKAIEKDGK